MEDSHIQFFSGSWNLLEKFILCENALYVLLYEWKLVAILDVFSLSVIFFYTCICVYLPVCVGGKYLWRFWCSFLLQCLCWFSCNEDISSQEFWLSCAGSFAGLSFLSWYLSGKIRAFDRKGHVAKLCIVFLPILLAALVGVSRVDDYWHHWQDVFAGGVIGLFYQYRWLWMESFLTLLFSDLYTLLSIILCPSSLAGATVASFCYLQFFPPPYDIDGMPFNCSYWLIILEFVNLSLYELLSTMGPWLNHLLIGIQVGEGNAMALRKMQEEMCIIQCKNNINI